MSTVKTTMPAPPLNHRTVLVKVDFILDVRGVSADVAYDMADGGLQWVWNVAVDPAGKIRDLRFWSREVIAPETTRGLDINDVIDLILGTRKNLHAGEMCHLLRVRRPTLLELREELGGHLGVHGADFPPAGLRDFLKARWLGFGASKKPATAVSTTFARPRGHKSLLPGREARQIGFRKRLNPSKP
jgi:hypothetical protein